MAETATVGLEKRTQYQATCVECNRSTGWGSFETQAVFLKSLQSREWDVSETVVLCPLCLPFHRLKKYSFNGTEVRLKSINLGSDEVYVFYFDKVIGISTLGSVVKTGERFWHVAGTPTNSPSWLHKTREGAINALIQMFQNQQRTH